MSLFSASVKMRIVTLLVLSLITFFCCEITKECRESVQKSRVLEKDRKELDAAPHLRLIDWSIDWLIDWLIGWFSVFAVGCGYSTSVLLNFRMNLLECIPVENVNWIFVLFFPGFRSVCERIVIELILQHQNQQQLTTYLWSAVRARGCQFLGPAMQEEVLKLVLLALESGSALSRKVLVMFIVQKLKPQYPQASKTSIGHVVQLLYRASCFKVCKRDGDSSLMELKEEFRTYET